jgi:hypothetical protein
MLEDAGNDAGNGMNDLLEFQLTFGLDDRCIEFLSKMPPHVKAQVVDGFRHSPEQTNASARCVAFAKKVSQGDQGGAVMGAVVSPLQQFQATWGIDDKCMEFLATLSPEVQATVCGTFNHQPGQTNVSARCFAFARSIQQRLTGTMSAPAQPVMLHQVAPVSYGATQSYGAKGKASPMSASGGAFNALVQFRDHWGVDDRCMDFLASLTPDVQATVIATFDHQPGQTNVSARCFGFAKSVQQKQMGGMPARAAPAPMMIQPRRFSEVTSSFGAAMMVAEQEVKSQRVSPVEDHLVAFQNQWGLDDKCIQSIASLPAAVQASVIAGFRHNPDQTNPSARCFAFAKKLMQSQPGATPFSPQQQFQSPQLSPLQQFQSWWGVDDKCMEFLASLSLEIQNTVVQTFDHQQGQTNVSARCFAFARSIQQRALS